LFVERKPSELRVLARRQGLRIHLDIEFAVRVCGHFFLLVAARAFDFEIAASAAR